MKKTCTTAVMPLALTVTSLITCSALADRPAVLRPITQNQRVSAAALKRHPELSKLMSRIKKRDPLMQALNASAGGGIAGTATLLDTGFEATETPTWTLGTAVQNGWTVGASNPASTTIANTHPASGSQHVHIVKGPGALGTTNGAISPNFGPLAPGAQGYAVDLSISASEGANYIVRSVSVSQGLNTAYVFFYYTDVSDPPDGLLDILVVDDNGGTPALFFLGPTWTPGPYYNVQVNVFGAGATPGIDYYIDGTYYGTGTIWAGSTVEQVVLYSDNYQNPGESGDYDNLEVVNDIVPACDGNTNGDGAVNVTDLLAVIGQWGPCVGCPPTHCTGDVAPPGATPGDCTVNVTDLLLIIAHWGPCP